jgi:hypothetical protein
MAFGKNHPFLQKNLPAPKWVERGNSFEVNQKEPEAGR